jgi:hypothetical protein
VEQVVPALRKQRLPVCLWKYTAGVSSGRLLISFPVYIPGKWICRHLKVTGRVKKVALVLGKPHTGCYLNWDMTQRRGLPALLHRSQVSTSHAWVCVV